MDKNKKNQKAGRQQAKRETAPEAKIKKQKKVQDSEDELSSQDEAPSFVPVQKKKPISAFAMLQDEDNDSNSEKSSDESEPEPVKVEPIKPVAQPKNPKKQPAKGNKKQEEEEDIDAILASISSTQTKPADKKAKKNKKGGKEIGESDQNGEGVKDEQQVQQEQKQQQPQQKITPEIRTDMTAEELAEILEAQLEEEDDDEDDRKKKKKKKKNENKQQQKQQQQKVKEDADSGDEEDENDDDNDEAGIGSTVKTNAQKKKEKKDRQKAEKMKSSQQQQAKTKPSRNNKEETTAQAEGAEKEDAQSEAQPPKKDKKKKKEEQEKEDKAKKPSFVAKLFNEQKKKLEEEMERRRRAEEEEREREEAERRLQEQKEEEEKARKERKKQKEKERIKRKKAEGTFKTEKQKEQERKAHQMLENIKSQGIEVPQVGSKIEKVVPDKPKRVVYASKPKKKPQQQQPQLQQQQQQQNEASTTPPLSSPTVEESQKLEAELQEEKVAEVKGEKEEVKENWDDSAEEEEDDEDDEEDDDDDDDGDDEDEDDDNSQASSDTQKAAPPVEVPKAKAPVEVSKTKAPVEVKVAPAKKVSVQQRRQKEDDSDNDDSDSSSKDENDEKTPREKAQAAMEKRRQAAEAARNPDRLRAPVICVMGHVDTGKTKILDKLRRSHVQDMEAGGITQQIGATNVPQSALKEQTKMCKEMELKIPGLLIIDTPGHESFSNLRTRGSSLCDLAILVVDIMHGLEAQTKESIAILRKRKTPFVVALNKIDRLYGWQTNPHSDIANLLKKQKVEVKYEFESKTKTVIAQFAEEGLNACLFYENKSEREYISMVPTSAISGDGMGNLISLVCKLTQTFLLKRVTFSEELQATVMEVKAVAGHGTTVDVILVNGRLAVGNTIVVAGQEGPIVTQIRSLLLPPPMHEIRVKNNFESHKEVMAAQGCKIAAKELEKAIAGLPLYVAHNAEEAEIYKEELSQMLKDVLSDIKVSDKGVYVQASTLGSLEALLTFLKTSSIPYSGINIGPVHKRDVVKTMAMLEHDAHLACILAFDVKVERDAQEMAESHGIQIFQADIIYHLFDSFTAYREKYKKQRQEEFRNIAMFPCKVRIMPECVFKSRDPIVVGVVVEGGFVKEGTVLCVHTTDKNRAENNIITLGVVTSIEVNHKQVDKATKGQEVCLKIENIPGETPKLYGRHFDSTDLIVSRISRESIDAVKNWFRDEMTTPDWKLIVDLKKIFGII